MQLVQVEGRIGRVRSAGLELDVALDLVPGAAVGDYVIVHAGCAIQSLPEEEAQETLAILRRLGESWEE